MLLSSPKIRSIYHTDTESIVETHGVNFNLAESEFRESLRLRDTPRVVRVENRGALLMISMVDLDWIQFFVCSVRSGVHSLVNSVQIEAGHVNRGVSQAIASFRQELISGRSGFSISIRIMRSDCKPGEFVQPCGGRRELYILCA